uniref:RNA-dependent RNA polymerase n=1 Tax=Khabarov virus TaxID=2707228 RepID=A0A6H0DIR9_9VIRU|nr:MAG: RNA-dependent RNA polymerase [Khabarov virus]
MRAEVSKTYLAPTPNEIEQVTYMVERLYRHAQWELPVDWFSYESMVAAVHRLDMTSSPGIPYMYESPTNGKWLEWDGSTVSPLKMARLWHDVRNAEEDPDHMFRVFVKDEPHKNSKARIGRWRLIMACPLHIQILWSMCFRIQNDKENDIFPDTPSAQGLVYPGGGWRNFSFLLDVHRVNTCIDKTAWDWLAPGWVFDVDLEVRSRLNRRPCDRWQALSTKLYEIAFHRAKLAMPDGRVYLQEIPGVMKTGLVNTIATNSRAQVELHCLACIRRGIDPGLLYATGDDTAQTEVDDDYIEELQRAGCVVKNVTIGKEFMGFNLQRKITPMYLDKHIVTLAHKAPVIAEVLESYLRMYCHSEWYSTWAAVAKELGVSHLSQASYQYWMDNPAALGNI